MNKNEREKARKKLIVDALEFLETFPTEAACLEEIISRAKAATRLICNDCGCDDFDREIGSRFGWCRACRAKKWFTANLPFFAHMKSARCHLALLFLKERGHMFSACWFAVFMNIAFSSAWELLAKFNAVALHMMESEQEDTVVLSSSAQFRPTCIRRSCSTPAEQHPSTEQEALEASNTPEASDYFSSNPETGSGVTGPEIVQTCSTGSTLSERLLAMLSSRPITVDELVQRLDEPTGTVISALTFLELDGLIEARAGGAYVKLPQDIGSKQLASEGSRSKISARTSPAPAPISHAPSRRDISESKPDADIDNCVNRCIRSIRAIHHGVSRKYLQRYLAGEWLFRALQRGSIVSLFDACCEVGEITLEMLKTYTTALEVLVSV